MDQQTELILYPCFNREPTKSHGGRRHVISRTNTQERQNTYKHKLTSTQKVALTDNKYTLKNLCQQKRQTKPGLVAFFPTSGQETELVAALSTPEPARGDVDDDDNDDR